MVSQIMLFENGLNLMRNMGYDSRIVGSSPTTPAKYTLRYKDIIGGFR